MNMKQRGASLPQHNYVRKLRYLMATGALPRDVGMQHVRIYHDDWCGVWQEKRCNCDPDIRLKWSVADAAQN
jgi:hypothetical protein